MLSPEEKAEIEEVLELYPTKRAAGVDALRIVQRHRGWISDEALADLSPLLDMSPAELDSVASFYNLLFRHPVGRHVILLCDSVSCYVRGYEAIREHLGQRLGIGFGETTEDGRFTLLPIACLGDCDHAPCMMVGEDGHRDLTPGKIDGILEAYE